MIIGAPVKIEGRKFLLGPFVVSEGDGCLSGDGMKFAGVSLQFSTANDGPFRVPIYVTEHPYIFLPALEDYYFPEDYCPFTVRHHPEVHVRHTSKTTFVSIIPLLAAMFSDFSPATPLTDALRSFSSHCPFGVSQRNFEPDQGALVPVLSKAGFALQNTTSFGDSIHVDLSWMPSPSRDSFGRLVAAQSGWLHFRPKHDGSLGDGKWGKQPTYMVGHCLLEFARSLGINRPIDCLSPEGVERCTNAFKWQAKHRLSRSQLAEMRLDLIKANPELWDDSRSLAQLLELRELYSPSTSLSQVKQHVSRTVETLRRTSQV